VAAAAAVVVLFLVPYALTGRRYPVAWGAATYVAKARSASQDGLALLGLIRPAGSLLLAVLMRATGQNGFTVVAIAPAVLAAVIGLAAAGMVRAALGIHPWWVPVISFLTWAAFVQNDLMTFHFDNLVNAVFVVAGFAAAVAFAGQGKGAVAAGMLFLAGGLAHWPFYLFAMGIFLFAIALSVWTPVGIAWKGWPRRLSRSIPLLASAAASGVLVLLSLFDRPPTGWTGVRLGPIAGRLRHRFLDAVAEPHSFYALPVSALGIAAAGLVRPAPERSGSRRLFICLMGAWSVVTVGAVVAQLAGIPAAGARVISFFFPLAILAGVAVWFAARWVATRGPRGIGMAAGGLIVVSVVMGLGGLTARWWASHGTEIRRESVRQVMSAGSYLAEVAPGRSAVFLVRGGLEWWVTQASLPPDELDRAFPYYDSPQSFLTNPSRRGQNLRFGPPPDSLGPDPVGILIERFNPGAFRTWSAGSPERVVAPGVFVLRGPLPDRPLPAEEPPVANVALPGLIWIPAVILGLLFLVGAGWAVALLPGDPVVRVALAPALGAASIVLAAVAWGLGGLPFTGLYPLVPVAISALLGWDAALVLARPRDRSAAA
jgi:hypothetical protein